MKERRGERRREKGLEKAKWIRWRGKCSGRGLKAIRTIAYQSAEYWNPAFRSRAL